MNEQKPSLFSPGVGKSGMNELHYAAYCGDFDGMLKALALGLSVSATDTYRGYTALHWLTDMAATGGPRLRMLEALVAHGADINARSSDRQTPLVLAREAGSKMGDRLADRLLSLGALE
ncbi:MAG TPA: ankyrin repeat domain-containing protein [Steroidobacter sp.]